MLQTRKQPTRLTHKFIISAGPAEAHAMNLLRLQKLPKPVQSFKLSSKILNCNIILDQHQGLTGSRYPTRPELFFKYPTRPTQKLKMTGYWVIIFPQGGGGLHPPGLRRPIRRLLGGEQDPLPSRVTRTWMTTKAIPLDSNFVFSSLVISKFLLKGLPPL